MGAGLISKDTGVIVQDDSVVIGKPSESWVTIKPEATTFESDANDGVTEIKGGQLTTDDLTATSGNIGNVTLENGKVTADKANIGDVWIKNGSITHVDKLAAERADIGGVWIKDDTITSLTNTEWDAENAVRNRAATEGQLLDVDTKVNQNTNKLDAYESAGIVAGTRNNPYTVDGIALGTDSYANGTGATAIGGDAKANQYNSVALGRGAVANAHDSVALGAYSIANDENVVSVGRDDGSIQRRIVNVADGEKDSDAATVGQMNKATDGMVKWDKDTDGSYKEGTIGGVTMKDGTLDVNGRFHVNDNGGFVVEDENGNRVFRVLSQGGLQAASGKFVVASDTGNVITQGSVTAESGTIGNIQLDGNEITGKDKAVSVNGVTLSEYSTTTTTARAESENQDGDILLSGSNGEINVSALDRITEDVADRTQKISYDSEKGITKIGDEYGVEFSNNGAISAAKGNFKVADNGNVTLKGDIDVKDSEDNTKVKVEAATGKITTEDTMYVNGNEEVATENYVNTATENMVEWDAGTKDTIHGVTLNNGTITAANSKFKVYDNGRVEAAGGKFNVWSSGGIGIGDKDADGNRLFSVNGNNGDVITKGDVTAQGTMYVKGDEEVATKSSVDTVNDTLADYENAGIIAGTSNVDNDVVIGSGSSNTAEYGIAIGEQASNTGFGSMAVGAHTMVSGNNSVALGFGSQATENNVVSVGGYAPGTQRRIINVADGIENSDVATVGQMNTKVAEATENMVEWDAGTNNTIHGVTLNGSTITAGGGAFNVYSTGGMTALYGKFAGSITAADEKFKVDGNGGITGQSLDVNKGIIKAADGKFNVYTSGGMTATYGKFDGGITAAGEKFNVDGNGKVTAQQIEAAGGNFQVWSTGGIRVGNDKELFTVNGYNGNVTTKGTMYVYGNKEVATKSSVDTVNDTLDKYSNAGIIAGGVAEGTTGAIALGTGANINNDASLPLNNAIAIGTNATAGRNNAVAIGLNSKALGENSLALGYGAETTRDGGWNSVALGYGSKANDNWVVSVGNGDNNEYRRIINVKDGVNAHDAATVGQMNSLIFGISGDTKSLTDGTLLTNKAKSLVEGINKNSEAIKLLDKGNEVNWDATTNNINEMQSKISTFSAMTSNVDWNAVNSVDWNAVSALSQVAPLSADVTGEFDTTREPINDGSSNTGDEINTGEGNTVNGDSHVTGNAQIDGTLNVKGEATFDGNATFNGKVDMNGELNMNNNKITGLAEGSIAEGSTDAVTGGQLFDMQSGLNSRMDNIESRMNDVEDRIDKVGAMAAAIANLRTMGYDPEAPTEIAVGVGQYKSETGLALGIFHYPNQDFMLSASISTSGDEVMGGIGATWKLGRKSAEERAKDEEERILAKAEEIKQAAKRAEVKAQADRHAQLLAEREEAGQPIRPVEEA